MAQSQLSFGGFCFSISKVVNSKETENNKNHELLSREGIMRKVNKRYQLLCLRWYLDCCSHCNMNTDINPVIFYIHFFTISTSVIILMFRERKKLIELEK